MHDDESKIGEIRMIFIVLLVIQYWLGNWIFYLFLSQQVSLFHLTSHNFVGTIFFQLLRTESFFILDVRYLIVLVLLLILVSYQKIFLSLFTNILNLTFDMYEVRLIRPLLFEWNTRYSTINISFLNVNSSEVRTLQLKFLQFLDLLQIRFEVLRIDNYLSISSTV